MIGGYVELFLFLSLFPTYYQPSLSKITLNNLPPLKTPGLKIKTFRGHLKRLLQGVVQGVQRGLPKLAAS